MLEWHQVKRMHEEYTQHCRQLVRGNEPAKEILRGFRIAKHIIHELICNSAQEAYLFFGVNLSQVDEPQERQEFVVLIAGINGIVHPNDPGVIMEDFIYAELNPCIGDDCPINMPAIGAKPIGMVQLPLAEARLDKDKVSIENAHRMQNEYADHLLRLPARVVGSPNKTLLGLRVQIALLAEIKELPDLNEYFVFFGVNLEQVDESHGQQYFTIMVGGINTAGEIIEDHVYDYLDPCPNQCPSGLLCTL